MTTNYFQQGNQLLRENKLDEAIAFYLKAIKQNSNFYGYYQNLGELLVKQGKLDEALVNYRCAVDLNPNSAWSHNVLGEVYAQQEAWQEAIAAYEMANKITPDFYIFQENLNDVLAKIENKNNINLAKISVLEEIKVSDIEPESYQLYLNSADELNRQGQIKPAILNYLKAIRAKPERHPPYHKILEGLLYSNDFPAEYLPEINRTCKYVIEEGKNNDYISHFLLGRSLTKQRKIEKAQKCFQSYVYHDLLQKNPEFIKNNWDSSKLRGPQFLIIGAPKCGTTTLHTYTLQHPQVLKPIYKETRYFDSKLFQQSSDYYFAHFPPTPENNSFITGESDPGYIYTKNGGQKILSLLPNIKLILILRNPVDRAISQYHHWVRNGKETNSLEFIIQSQLNLIQGARELSWQVFSQTGEGYLTKGIYYFFLKEWLNIVPREQMLILKTEDFNQEPSTIMRQVFDFLEVPEHPIETQKRYNTGSYEPISPDMRRKLSQFYRPYNQQLEELLGMNFDWD